MGDTGVAEVELVELIDDIEGDRSEYAVKRTTILERGRRLLATLRK